MNKITFKALPRLHRDFVQLSKYPVVIPLYKAADHRVAEVSNLKLLNYLIKLINYYS
jgi:hypothetical protein